MKRKCLCRLSAVTLMLAAAFFCKGIDKTVKIIESKCNSPLRMSKMKNCKKADNAAKTHLNQGFLKI